MRWRLRTDPVVLLAMTGASMIGAQFVAGKAARDALFLSYYEPSALPAMIIGTSLVSIALVVSSSRLLARLSPSLYVPRAFAVSAALLVVEWALVDTLPKVAAPIVYLHISGLGPMLGSGFWLMASERFDPRSAKKRFGQIGGAGTIGGLVGGLVAARIAAVLGAPAMLPLLAGLNAACFWQARALASRSTSAAVPGEETGPVRSGWNVLKEATYLRQLAGLVLFGTIAAALVDYVFKVQVKSTFGGGPELGSFFSLYYATVSLLTFVLQTFASRPVLEKAGLAAAMSVPSLTFIVGGVASFFAPGLRALVATRGTEAVVRGSLMRSGYELYYTPIPAHDKRAVKAIIDVGVDRAGDILGAVLIQILIWTVAGNSTGGLLALAVSCSIIALAVASRLNRGYVAALERSLLTRAVEVDLTDVEDLQTRTIVLRTLHRSTAHIGPQTLAEPQVKRLISLLASDQVAEDAIRGLRRPAIEQTEVLLAVLLDPNTPFVIRRRLARVFAVCRTQRAADGLLAGLDDLRFEVRFRCGRSLRAVVDHNPAVTIDRDTVRAAILREVAVSQGVWESRQLIDASSEAPNALEDLVTKRADRALTHVFTLLGLILPSEPLRIAYRGLHTSDKGLRGTALEYLESVLPSDIRDQLWRFLEDDRPPRHAVRPHAQVLQQLLQSSESIVLNLAEMQRKDPTNQSGSTHDLVDDLQRVQTELARRTTGEVQAFVAKPSSSRPWLIVHQLAMCAVYVGMLAPMWMVRAWLAQPWSFVFFFAMLATVATGTSLRLHLSFTARMFPRHFIEQHRTTSPYSRACDAMFALAQLVAAALIGPAHPEVAMLLVAVSSAVLVASFVIEPAVARAVQNAPVPFQPPGAP